MTDTFPQKEYVWNGQAIRKQPPWIMRLCRAPDTANIDAPCSFLSSECKGGRKVCTDCGWHYCNGHFKAHQQTWPLPRDATKTFLRRLFKQNNRRAKVQAEALPEDLDGPEEWLE